MDCTRFLDRYSDYDDSLLSPEELSAFRGHLAVCPSCARYDRVLRKGRMLARQLPAPDPDPGLTLRLQRRLAAARSRRSRTGVVLPPLATAALAAVTVLLVATSTLALLERVAEPVRERAVVAAARPDAGIPGMAWPASTVVPVALDGRTLVLPPVSARAPRAWAAQRVDHRLASSYSPLVMGPPAYRAGRAYASGPGTSTRRTLD